MQWGMGKVLFQRREQTLMASAIVTDAVIYFKVDGQHHVRSRFPIRPDDFTSYVGHGRRGQGSEHHSVNYYVE